MEQDEIIQWKEDKQFEKPTWPADVYPAVLIKQESFMAEHGEKKRFIFEVSNAISGQIVEFAYSCYPNLKVTTKLGQMVLALGLKKGDRFSWPKLIGKQCRVVLETQLIDGMERSVITKILERDRP